MSNARIGLVGTAWMCIFTLLVLLFPIAAWAQLSSAGGYYTICDPSNGAMADANCRSAVSRPILGGVPNGVRLNIEWSKLQPYDPTGIKGCAIAPCGNYNWNVTTGAGSQSIDAFLANAKVNNQNIAVSLHAGFLTPQWARGAVINCGSDVVNMPAPWDSTFLANYNAAINALAAHLISQGVAPWVKIVHFSGIDTNTGEFYLVNGGANTANCRGGNVSLNQAWASAGFTPNKIQGAANTLLDNYVRAFSSSSFKLGIIFSINVIYVNAFPPIDNGGNIYVPPPKAADALTRQVLQSLLTNTKYSNVKFAVQYNWLTNVPTALQDLISSYKPKNNLGNIYTAWQMNNGGGRDEWRLLQLCRQRFG